MLSSAYHGAKEGLQTYTFESLSRLYNKKDQGCAKRDRRVSVTTYYRLLHKPEIKGFSWNLVLFGMSKVIYTFPHRSMISLAH